MRKYNFNEHYFDVIDCQEKAYWLGFFAADGYNHASKGCIEFRLHKQDKEILEKFKSCIEANNPIGLYKQTYCNLSLYSKHLCDKLSEYGLSQAKTYTLQIPELDDVLMRHFIRGYFDGDGCLQLQDKIYHCRFDLTSASKVFLEQVRPIITKQAFTNGYLGKETKYNVYHLNYTGHQVKKILDWLYLDSNFYLKRKYDKYQILKSMSSLKTR